MPRPRARPSVRGPEELATHIGQLVVRFQDGTARMDRAAGQVLGLSQEDLPTLAVLFFGGPTTKTTLAKALSSKPPALRATLDRLRYAGYVNESSSTGYLELTHHARNWIATLWRPLQDAGRRLCSNYSPAELASVADFLAAACLIQERNAARVLALLNEPAAAAPQAQSRGGLSPAALRRVQLFVEANLSESIRLADLAERALLSEFHFARAFKRSTGTTPRAYVETRRIAAAERLLGETDLPLAGIALAVGFGS